MSIITLSDVRREIGAAVILDEVTLSVAAGERIGLVGPNAQEALFTVLDVASKFGFAVFLLVGTFSLLSPVKG